MDEDPNNDVTPPCPDCGEVAIPCECGKPIETVAQLQRALEAAGLSAAIAVNGKPFDREWGFSLWSSSDKVCCYGRTLSEAVAAAFDAWWHRDD